MLVLATVSGLIPLQTSAARTETIPASATTTTTLEASTTTTQTEPERLEIIGVGYPGSIPTGGSFTVDVKVRYVLNSPTDVVVDLYENAGPLLASNRTMLSGDGREDYDLAVTAPSMATRWQLNIHLQGEFKQPIYIDVVQQPPTKVKVYIYAIDDSNRQHSYNIQDVTKIAGAQIRVEYSGFSQVLTTGSSYPGPYVEVDENSNVTVTLVQNPSVWTFAGQWDVYTISWTAGDSRSFNAGTSNKHVSASFNPVLQETNSYWPWGVMVVAIVISAVALVIFKFRRKPIAQSRPNETLDEEVRRSTHASEGDQDMRYVEYLAKLEELKTRGQISEETHLKLKDEYWKRFHP